MSPHRIIDGVPHHLPGEAISWVGLCPWTGEPAFGTESGKLHVRGLVDEGEAIVSISSDVINGVAFSGDRGCVTSGEDVTIFNRRNPETEKHSFGAHDVVALALGGFLAPLGPSGMMVARCGPGGDLAAIIASPSRVNLNSYRACSLGIVDGIEYLACASRRGGLMAGHVPPQMASPKVHGAGALDFVDVCSLGSAQWPFAAVALGVDGSLFFGRDLVSEPGEVMHFAEFPGRAYSLKHVGDHLVVLTSRGLLVFPELAADYLAGRRRVRQPCSMKSMEASEIFSIGDDLYVLVGDGYVPFSVQSLVNQRAGLGMTDNVADWHSQGLPDVLPPMPEHPLAA